MEKKDFIEEDSQKTPNSYAAQENENEGIEPRGKTYFANYYALYEGDNPVTRGSFEAWDDQISLYTTREVAPMVFYVGKDKYQSPFMKLERSRLNGYPIMYSPNDQLRIDTKGELELAAGTQEHMQTEDNLPQENLIILKKDGKVGIGTRAPGEKLDVNGDTRIDGKLYVGYTHGESIRISTANLNKYALFVQKGILSEDYAIGPKNTWSDFVFDKDYKLRSLDEVEEFIDTNNHLPELPSTKEIQEEGYSLHDMNVKLLQKVEELTLYIIQLNKEIEGLKKEK